MMLIPLKQYGKTVFFGSDKGKFQAFARLNVEEDSYSIVLKKVEEVKVAEEREKDPEEGSQAEERDDRDEGGSDIAAEPCLAGLDAIESLLAAH